MSDEPETDEAPPLDTLLGVVPKPPPVDEAPPD